MYLFKQEMIDKFFNQEISIQGDDASDKLAILRSFIKQCLPFDPAVPSGQSNYYFINKNKTRWQFSDTPITKLTVSITDLLEVNSKKVNDSLKEQFLNNKIYIYTDQEEPNKMITILRRFGYLIGNVNTPNKCRSYYCISGDWAGEAGDKYNNDSRKRLLLSEFDENGNHISETKSFSSQIKMSQNGNEQTKGRIIEVPKPSPQIATSKRRGGSIISGRTRPTTVISRPVSYTAISV